MERVARFADYENEAIETPRRKRGAAAVIYDININIINMYIYVLDHYGVISE